MTDLSKANELYEAGYFDDAIELASIAENNGDEEARTLVAEIRLQRDVDVKNVNAFMQRLGGDLNTYRGFDGLVSVLADGSLASGDRAMVSDNPQQVARDEFERWLETHLDMAYIQDSTLRWSKAAVKGKVIFIVNAQLDAYIGRYHRYAAIHDGWFNPPITIGSFAISSVFIGPKLWFAVMPRAERDSFRDSGLRANIDAEGNFDYQVSRIDKEKKSQVKNTISNKVIIDLYRKINDLKITRMFFNKKIEVSLNLIKEKEMKRIVIDDIIMTLDGILSRSVNT